MSINLISGTTLSTGTLIADSVSTAGGSNDSIPSLTIVDGQPVDAALEIQSTAGGLLPPRMTEAERDDLNATSGLIIFNTDTEQLDIFIDPNWEQVSGGVGGGDVSVVPGGVIAGNIAIFADTSGQLIQDSGVSISQVPAPAPLVPLLEEISEAALVTVNQIGNLGHIQFVNDIGIIFVDSLIPVEFITNNFGPDSQVCSLFTGGLPSSSTTPSALVELQSTTGAFVISRMNNLEVSDIQKTPGMMLYNTEIASYVLFQDTTAGINIGGTGIDGDNFFTGYLAGPFNSLDGKFNTGFGTNVFNELESASGNTAVGYFSGSIGNKLSDCTFIGSLTGATNSDTTNSTAIGANTIVGTNNAVVLGNSCYVGIGNASPGYTLDLGNISSQCGIRLENTSDTPATPASGSGVFYVSSEQPYFLDSTGTSTLLIPGPESVYPPTYNNQLVNVSQGNSQGGYGGGSLGSGNITMSAANTTVFNTTTINANSKGFSGSAFDGRYIYCVPNVAGASVSGQITRYDTKESFTTAGSYSIFNTTAVNPNSKGFQGAVFDGRYVYFVPTFGSGQITRYDTTMSFTDVASYSIFDTTIVNGNSRGFYGAVFDGRYVYFVPYFNGVFSGQITRYDTTASFTAGASYSVFDTTTVDANSKGFFGAVFDGRYVYFVPNTTDGITYSGQITRYDTTLSFTSAGSYSVFNTVTFVNANSKGFFGAVFDGRYVYFVPYITAGATFSGQITRYDTTLSFTSSGSYSVFDTTTVNTNSRGFYGAVFDGHYIYFVPNVTVGSVVYGQVTRYDITKPFTSISSYSVFDTTTVDANSKGFQGGMYDGKYVYLIPKNGGTSGQITRMNAYSGPQLLPFELIESPPTYNNQSANLSQGYNQGGFGGGSVGSGNVPMSTVTTVAFNTQLVNTNSTMFAGSAFDGRYLYLAPAFNNGQVTRLDTRAPFTTSSLTSYAVFDTTTVNANSKGFLGAVFDGRYVYFVPDSAGGGITFGQVTRYDTMAPFTSPSSYSVFDTTTVNANSKGFFGAAFDGKYIYFVPNGSSGGSLLGQVTRYNTTASFTASGSYSVFDTTTVNADSVGFAGGAFDGRYVYYIPNAKVGARSGQITRYDTTLSFTAGASYSVFDTTTVDANSKGFLGAVFDGRYLYLVPNTTDGLTFSGQITRYDTTASFTAAGSYSVFDTTTVNANSKGFFGAVFDGRFIYFVPQTKTLGVSFGQITRYDITKSFTSAASYSVFNAELTNANSKGFAGGMYDGKYVYFTPYTNGYLTRINAYSGPQLPPFGGL